MKNRLTVFLGCYSLIPMTAFAQQRMNIIYIMTDQQAATAMSCAGNNDLKTPAMDALAKRGVRFTNAYCALPLSGPSRSAMFTGYMPSDIGMQENETPLPDSVRARTLGNMMEEASYECAYAGKWHVNTNSLPGEHAFGFKNLHGHNDKGLAEDAVNFLRQRDKKKPFFLVASFNMPHGICEAARHQNLPFGEIEEPDLKDCPQLPANYAVNPYDATALAFEKTRNHRLYPSLDYTADDWRKYLYSYYRQTELGDHEIGKILDEIDKEDLWKNTVVIFTSDHGDGAAQHQWNQKTVLYESVANIPFIICLPKGKNAGKVLPQLVNNGIDLMPTICDFAGIPVPAHCQGKSLRNVVEAGDPDMKHQEYVVTETVFAQTAGTIGWMVRTKDYKYVLYDTGRYREQLYDMNTDRGEMRNLAMERKYSDIVKLHRQLLGEWMDKHPSKLTRFKNKYIPKD